MKITNDVSEDKIFELASQVTTLLGFASLLIEDVEILEKVYKEAGDISSHVSALVPVLTAVGEDYEEKHIEAEVRRKRALAIVELVKVIRDTEAEREDYKAKKANKDKVRRELGGALGL